MQMKEDKTTAVAETLAALARAGTSANDTVGPHAFLAHEPGEHTRSAGSDSMPARTVPRPDRGKGNMHQHRSTPPLKTRHSQDMRATD